MEYRLTTPCTAQDLAPLKAGDTVLLSGVVYTARDQAHKRMMEALDKGETLARIVRAGAEETTLYADLDVERLEAIRAQLPILSARRTDLYEVREK